MGAVRASSRRSKPKPGHAGKVNAWCGKGMHLWCPNKAGRYGREICVCGCHAGRVAS